MIILANQQTLDKIIQIEANSFKTNDRFSKSVLKYHIRQKKTYCVLNKKEVVAYMILIYYKNSVRIYSLAVDKPYRRQLFASRLLSTAYKIAKRKKKKYLSLEVNINNKDAIDLYLKYKYENMHTLKNYYHNGDNAYKMIKTLPYK